MFKLTNIVFMDFCEIKTCWRYLSRSKKSGFWVLFYKENKFSSIEKFSATQSVYSRFLSIVFVLYLVNMNLI